MNQIEAFGDGFVARTTTDGEPTRFEVCEGKMLIHRGTSVQTIEIADGLGAIAICSIDGQVLGYGSMEIDKITDVAERLDKDGDATMPLTRLAAHGLAMILPLDDMPAEVRDQFLAEKVDPELVEMARMTDDAITEAIASHDHDHDHSEVDCDVCDVRALQNHIEDIITQSGHAVILVPDEKRQISYTAGLSDGGWCELAMSGIPGQALMILNEVVGVLRASDRRPADGMIVEKAVSVPLKLRKVRDTSIGPVARSREEKAGRKRPNFIQVLWPDADGYYPDQMEYDDINLPQELL